MNELNQQLTPEYDLLCKQLSALLDGEDNPVTNMSQFSALVFNHLSAVNWAGFYLSGSKGFMQLGPFQGQVACTKIPIGKGVCGTAAASGKTQRVDDVDQFEGHIACDSRSRSEIVCPLVINGNVFAVFDLDSPDLNRFDQQDQAGIEAMVKILLEGTQWESFI